MVLATNVDDPPRLRYDPGSGYLVVGSPPDEVIVRHDGASLWVARIEDVGQVRAVVLQRVLRRANGDYEGYAHDDFEVVENQKPGFDIDYAVSDVRFTVAPGRLALTIYPVLDEWEDDDAELLRQLRQIAGPLLRRTGTELLEASVVESAPDGTSVCSVTVVPSLRGRTIAKLYHLGLDVLGLLNAAGGGSLSLTSIVLLVVAGRGDILLGQPEGQWLDAKSQDYDLDSDTGKISLAQDVARFANGETGGAIVIGLRTKRVSGGEVIEALSPVPRPKSGTRRHRQAIDNRVFPAPDGLTMQEVATGTGAMIVIHVPPQPEEHKPFLVHGAIVNGKVEGAFISILRRRGEESIPITAQSIHATLAAGRALLRRGELPPVDSETTPRRLGGCPSIGAPDLGQRHRSGPRPETTPERRPAGSSEGLHPDA